MKTNLYIIWKDSRVVNHFAHERLHEHSLEYLMCWRGAWKETFMTKAETSKQHLSDAGSWVQEWEEWDENNGISMLATAVRVGSKIDEPDRGTPTHLLILSRNLVQKQSLDWMQFCSYLSSRFPLSFLASHISFLKLLPVDSESKYLTIKHCLWGICAVGH